MEHKKPSILVLDDESEVCNILSKILETKFDVTPCSLSWDVMSVLSPKTFDVILSDFYMPGTSGLGLIQELKAQYPNTHIALMTGALWNQAEEDEAIAAGASLVAYKPFGCIRGFVDSLYALAIEKQNRVA